MPWSPDYITSAQLKAYMGVTDAVDDAQVAWAITTASRAIETHTNRQFGLVAAPEARYYTAEWDRDQCRWIIDIDDLQTTTGLLVNADNADDGTYTDVIDEYALRPVNAAPKGQPWTRIVVHPTSTNLPTGRDAGVEVTARYGWTTVPVAVEQACALQAHRLFKRRGAAFGVAGSPELGNELRLLAKLDPDVGTSLTDYVRWWAAA